MVQKRQKGVENGRRETVLSISWTKIDRRRSRKVMEGLRTPKNDIKNKNQEKSRFFR